MGAELVARDQSGINWAAILAALQQFICSFMAEIDTYVNSLPAGTEKSILSVLAMVLSYICKL